MTTREKLEREWAAFMRDRPFPPEQRGRWTQDQRWRDDNPGQLDQLVAYRAGGPRPVVPADGGTFERMIWNIDAWLDTAPSPPVQSFGVREGPRGTLTEVPGGVFLRDDDGATTAGVYVPRSPAYGIANMTWPFNGPSSGLWVVRDNRTRNVVADPPGSMDGRGEAGLWIGEKALVERGEFDGEWMGGTVLAAGMGSRVYDAHFTSPRIPLYPEHPAHDIEFHHCTFGPKYGTTTRQNRGSSINAEWWYGSSNPAFNPAYSTYLSQLLGPVSKGKHGTHDLRFYDCDIWCPPIPNPSAWDWYTTAGAFLDAGTFAYRHERCRFWGPGLARAIPSDRLMIDPSRPNVAIDCVYENQGDQLHVFDNRMIG